MPGPEPGDVWRARLAKYARVEAGSFLNQITSDEVRTELQRARRRDRVLAALTDILGPERSLDWLHSFGVCNVPEIAAHFPPVPPEKLRRITASPWAEVFLWSGLVDATMFAELLDKHQEPAARNRDARVLDFACGCGRIARFMSLWRCELAGCDLNPELVAWCEENLRGFEVTAGSRLPPLAYAGGSFDYIYAYSLFTHTPEDATLGWLEEFHRMLAPGAVVAFTTNGMTTIAVLSRSEQLRQQWGITEEQLAKFRELIKEGGLASIAYDAMVGEVDPGIGKGYGLIFVGLFRIAKLWTAAGFEVLEQIPGGSRGIQDVTVFRRR